MYVLYLWSFGAAFACSVSLRARDSALFKSARSLRARRKETALNSSFIIYCREGPPISISFQVLGTTGRVFLRCDNIGSEIFQYVTDELRLELLEVIRKRLCGDQERIIGGHVPGLVLKMRGWSRALAVYTFLRHPHGECSAATSCVHVRDVHFLYLFQLVMGNRGNTRDIISSFFTKFVVNSSECLINYRHSLGFIVTGQMIAPPMIAIVPRNFSTTTASSVNIPTVEAAITSEMRSSTGKRKYGSRESIDELSASGAQLKARNRLLEDIGKQVFMLPDMASIVKVFAQGKGGSAFLRKLFCGSDLNWLGDVGRSLFDPIHELFMQRRSGALTEIRQHNSDDGDGRHFGLRLHFMVFLLLAHTNIG